ncbi:SDR family NAD(P)-dependent oxidoreductase [Hoeflea alexandrii]|uniref:SDR family NAD(P)-dependent oxidoreductase n=1 Tax=Hoeflea alexandrii TaxID=288436 RepID=UPI0022AEAA39|nr:SDR family oxidoreductase [Hoeflea alexandrii]MCZ4291017.1 SDR family NAD(P)-dependent oxidoreductase [Hoeflea alexandrii]
MTGPSRILVTGAGSGIGRALAELLSRRDVAVVGLDLDPGAKASWPSVEADVSDADAVQVAVDRAAELLGGLEGVANCAGVSLRRSLDLTTAEEWAQVMAVNLTGPFNVCRAALPWLKQAPRPAAIVNIASGAAFRPQVDFSAYCASKGGLVAFGRALAHELAPAGIRVNSLCPGVIATPMIDRALARSSDRDAAEKRFLGLSAMGRMGTAAELAEVAAFLLSDESSYVTGAAWTADGGGTYH